MTLEEAIIKAKHNSIKENLSETIQKLSTVDHFVENQKQLADWLEELKDLRKCVKSSAFVDGYNKALDDMYIKLYEECSGAMARVETEPKYCGGLLDGISTAMNIAEKLIAEKLKAGGKE